jgi:hypothetical protein
VSCGGGNSHGLLISRWLDSYLAPAAWFLLAQMVSGGVPPSTRWFNSVLGGCGAMACSYWCILVPYWCVFSCFLLVQMVSGGVPPSTKWFNSVLGGCGAMAGVLLGEMAVRGAGPDAKTYATAILAWVREDQPQVGASSSSS